jgi:hypothetical protein
MSRVASLPQPAQRLIGLALVGETNEHDIWLARDGRTRQSTE